MVNSQNKIAPLAGKGEMKNTPVNFNPKPLKVVEFWVLFPEEALYARVRGHHPWQDDDAEWFVRNSPSETRLRKSYPMEWSGVFNAPHALIATLAPGVHIKRPVYGARNLSEGRLSDKELLSLWGMNLIQLYFHADYLLELLEKGKP